MDKAINAQPLTMDRSGLKRNALVGDVAVVTGGSSNIGLGTARCLAWLGARIVIASRTKEPGEAGAALINKETTPGTAIFVSTDVSDEASVSAMARTANETFGKVDILVNNAMDLSLGGQIMKTTVGALDRQYQVAVRGAFLGIHAFVPGMLQRRHGVVTYLATRFCYPSASNYCAAKAATSSMIASLAGELGPVKKTGVAVFQFVPTVVGRPRTAAVSPTSRGPSLDVPGYGTSPIPPEDAGAALAYCIVRAADIHGSGVNCAQAMKRMKWPYPQPDSMPPKDFDRLRDPLMVRMFGYLGPGWPDKIEPLVSVNRSEAPEGEPLSVAPLFK